VLRSFCGVGKSPLRSSAACTRFDRETMSKASAARGSWKASPGYLSTLHLGSPPSKPVGAPPRGIKWTGLAGGYQCVSLAARAETDGMLDTRSAFRQAKHSELHRRP